MYFIQLFPYCEQIKTVFGVNMHACLAVEQKASSKTKHACESTSNRPHLCGYISMFAKGLFLLKNAGTR